MCKLAHIHILELSASDSDTLFLLSESDVRGQEDKIETSTGTFFILGNINLFNSIKIQ